MTDKPKVGQTLYSLNVGNAARNVEKKLTPVIVRKVGRKYFYCSKSGRSYVRRYYLSDWREECGGYCADSFLYNSVQEYEDEKKAEAIKKKIQDVFRWDSRVVVHLTALIEIDKILDNCKGE